MTFYAPLLKFSSAPPDDATTEYQISNRGLSYFQGTCYSNFLNIVIGIGEVCSLVVMGIGYQVLSVLQCH